MNILNIEHVSKVFGEKVVLDDVSYGVHQGDKIGIIGINGTGKSTILKIIGGLEEPDEGQVITQNGLRITYLPQMPEFPQGASVLDYVAEGKWQKDWSTESEARNVLNKLGITDHLVGICRAQQTAPPKIQVPRKRGRSHAVSLSGVCLR